MWAALGIVLAGLLVPMTARADEGGEGFDPRRTSDGTAAAPYYRFDGWSYNAPSGTTLTGATATTVAYSPYTLVGTSQIGIATWSMLDDAPSTLAVTGDLAQVGWVEFPGNSFPSNFTRYYFWETQDLVNGVQFNRFTHSTNPEDPNLTTAHSFNTEYDASTMNIHLAVAIGPTELFSKDVANTVPNWRQNGQQSYPVQAFVSSETHTASEQMPGDAEHPVDLTNVGWEKSGGTGNR